MEVAAVARLPIVAVIGSSRPIAPPLEARCRAAGRFIARSGWHLLTGGGPGVMGAASSGFCAVEARAGLSIGILPEQLPPGVDPTRYPNPWVEVPIQTHLGVAPEGVASRNPINVLSARAILAFPGAQGTQGEVMLARRYGRPLVAWLTDGETIGALDAARLAGLAVEVRTESDPVFAFLREAIERPLS